MSDEQVNNYAQGFEAGYKVGCKAGKKYAFELISDLITRISERGKHKNAALVISEKAARAISPSNKHI